MCEPNNEKRANKVSNFLNIQMINSNRNTEIEQMRMMCEKYCNDNTGKNFEIIKTKELKKVYEDGMELLNTYYIMDNKENIINLILQIQFITSQIKYIMENRQIKDLIIKNNELNKDLSNTIKKAEILEENANKEKEEITEIRKEVKTIITTIISIVLAISIIPTAIAGIEKVDSNYILPFLSSVILFGVIMIMFVYSIYENKFKVSTWIIFSIVIIVTLFLWLSSIFNIIDINKYETIVENVYKIAD